jgi:hypothetical protein
VIFHRTGAQFDLPRAALAWRAEDFRSGLADAFGFSPEQIDGRRETPLLILNQFD